MHIRNTISFPSNRSSRRHV